MNNSSIKNRVFVSKIKRQILSHVRLIRFVIVIFLIGILVCFSLVGFGVLSKTFLWNFAFPSKQKILTDKGEVNILVLTKENTIPVIVSISLEKNNINLILVPQVKTGPLVLLKADASFLTKIPIQYGVVFDKNLKVVDSDLNEVTEAILTRYILEAHPPKFVDPIINRDHIE